MPVKAVFFDRDGTINYDPGYLRDPEKVKLYPGVCEGIKLLKDHQFQIYVVSNQSGIARGLITEADVISVNSKINSLLKKKSTSIDAFFYCPFHPEFNDSKSCECRKPSPKMIIDAVKKYNIDISSSFMVGDKAIDIECGNNAGVETILVMNGKNEEEINSLHNDNKKVNFIAQNFLNACEFIIKSHLEDNC